MAQVQRNDEQITVGTTVGLIAGATSFTFDGTGGKPDYRNYIILPFEINGRSPMVTGLDYSWNYVTGMFSLLLPGDVLSVGQVYNIHFQPYVVPIVISGGSSFVDWSYFIRNINIPNIDPSKTANASNYQRLNLFISKYEPECLRGILGYSLYSVILNETSQRVIDLVYGVSYYNYCGELRRWNGLIYGDISLIANYIYYYYTESNATQLTGVNTQVPNGENAVAVSPAQRMLNAWNFFSEESQSLFSFLWTKNRDASNKIYPEFTTGTCYWAEEFSRHNESPF